MREITVEGRHFLVRGLTRGEVKALKTDGINLLDLSMASADDAIDAVFEIVFDEDTRRAIDGMVNSAAMSLWQAVLKETYGAGDEEKN